MGSVQNGVQSNFGGALIEDSDSTPKKDKVASVAGPLGEHKLEDFGAPGGMETGSGQAPLAPRCCAISWYNTLHSPSGDFGGTGEFESTPSLRPDFCVRACD